MTTDAKTLDDLLAKVCLWGYQPTPVEVSHINDLLYELKKYRDGGLTEELLRRNDGCIKVGRGCAITLEKP